MKKMIFALVALMVVVSCSETPQDKMEKVIKAAMEKEYLTYEPMKFGEEIDTVYTTIEEAQEGWWKSYHELKRKEEQAMLLNQHEVALVYIDAMTKTLDVLDSIKQHFQPELVGYTIKHSFKNNDKTYTMTFLLNPELTEVLKSY